MINDLLKITILLEDEQKINFENISLNTSSFYNNNGVKLKILQGEILEVQFNTDNLKIKSIEYDFSIEMKNYYSAILPESGRWFFNALRIVNFWKNFREFSSCINDIKIPLLILTGRNMYTGTAVGIIGENYETNFKLLEPESNRALNVHTGHIVLKMVRGTVEYPISNTLIDSTQITEFIYYKNYSNNEKSPWLLTMREFSQFQKKCFNLKEIVVKNTLYPLWCTWADWHSNDLNAEMILENVKIGLENGIKNYIIDDGWFGPGLDNDYDVPLNIGDWEPDSNKIPDMKDLVNNIHNMGANAIIWCAPHAVAKGANCYLKRERFLIADNTGSPILNPTQFYSLCFMNKESREIMADICVNLILKWNFDGAKYDLFNWIPNVKCENPNHTHDVESMIEGLNKTLQLIDHKTRKIKQNYIVELKQNYGTAFLSRWGTMMRAGDAPYDSESNFLRTMHVQSYTPFSLNDYQTFTKHDSPEDISIAIIKMLSAGIPAYSINFSKLTDRQNQVIKYLNNWYCSNLDIFVNYRIPCDANNYLVKLKNCDSNIYFLVNEIVAINDIMYGDIILNGSYYTKLMIKNNYNRFSIESRDCNGNLSSNIITNKDNMWEAVDILPGGSLIIKEDLF